MLITEGIGATGLSSPAKQLFHLLGLMLVTPPSNQKPVEEKDWKALKNDLEGAFNQYALMYFPTEEDVRMIESTAFGRGWELPF